MIRTCIIGMTIFLIGSTLTVEARDQRVAYVDLEQVLQDYHRAQTAIARLERQAEENRAERDARVERLRELQRRYEEALAMSRDTALSASAREEQRNEAIMLDAERDRLEEDTQRELNERLRQQRVDEQRIYTRLVDEITEFIERHARNQGYHAVIDSSARSASGVPIVLHVDSRVDITRAVIEALNEGR